MTALKTPCYVVNKQRLINNLEILKSVKDRTGCKVLLASKCFSMYSLYPLIGQYLDGVCASGVNEARLGREEMDKEVHTFSPAFYPNEFDDIVRYSNDIVFNSYSQYERYKDQLTPDISVGLRVNPECSTQDHGIYDPCAIGSRLGLLAKTLEGKDMSGIDGFHFHTLCEQGSEDLETTLVAFEEKFAKYLPSLKWINFGGGHHITKPGYNIELLIELVNRIQDKYQVQVILEPGEAVALDAGELYASVLDFNENHGVVNAILDASAACHMPDVIEMPYRPRVVGENPEGKYTYRFGGPTCLAGDVIGDYSFDKPLHIGETVIFEDMAIYTMVKNNTFNGMNLPAIYIEDGEEFKLVKEFGYEDFKCRLS
ncbi:MAG: carboxynorspermidine decarboxylase [Erysipelotrichaceae bacterium]|nr:carboxynorspermidine decarboxylase [Erysipelotrichaceae bacterium]